MTEETDEQPQFQMVATARGFLTDGSARRRTVWAWESIQLSRSEDYDGGDLELFLLNQPQKVERARGVPIAFPSFVLHRVAPVTRGTRWSLVAWVLGKRWR